MIEILEHSSAPESVERAVARSHALADLANRRRAPLVLMAVVVAMTMAYSLSWGPLVRHVSAWIAPGDIWGTLRSAQFVGWGDIGDVFGHGTGLVTLPGISVVLTPVALLVSNLHLSMSFPYGLPHPTGWLVLGPYEAAIGAVVLIPLDALAEQLGLEHRRRVLLSIIEAVLVWPVVGIWGHPEDPLALAFALWGLLAVMKGRWRSAGWLVGLALAIQPLVVLMVPVLVALVPVREWPKLALRCTLPAVALLVIPLEQSWRATTEALFKQPNFPTVDHATPWLALAPVLSPAHPATTKRFFFTTLPNGAPTVTGFTAHTIAGPVVAAGPGRLIAIAFALLIGVYVFRRHPGPSHVVWLCAVALGLRCVFESVMDPFYLWPPLAIAFVLAARSYPRLGVAIAAGTLITWWSYRFLGPWEWWTPVVILLAVILASAAPARSEARVTTEHRLEGPPFDPLPDRVHA